MTKVFFYLKPLIGTHRRRGKPDERFMTLAIPVCLKLTSELSVWCSDLQSLLALRPAGKNLLAPSDFLRSTLSNPRAPPATYPATTPPQAPGFFAATRSRPLPSCAASRGPAIPSDAPGHTRAPASVARPTSRNRRWPCPSTTGNWALTSCDARHWAGRRWGCSHR